MPSDTQSPASGFSYNALIELINQARKAVPVIDYALGAVGAGAAGVVLVFFLGTGKGAAIVLAGVFIAMLLLYIFSRLAVAKTRSVVTAGIALIWAVTLFFIAFLVFTVSAVAVGWPSTWAGVLGVSAKPDADQLPTSANWSVDNCRSIAERASRNFVLDPTDTRYVDSLLVCKNPLGFAIRGNAHFYNGAFPEAESAFLAALSYSPREASKEAWESAKSNLANTLIETGKFREAVDHLKELVAHSGRDNYRWDLARAYLYQAQFNPNDYNEAIYYLQGVNPDFRGMTGNGNGKVQIIWAAALVGKAQQANVSVPEAQANLASAQQYLCKGIRKSELFWRTVLNGTSAYPHASLKEEKRLLAAINGGNIQC